MSPELEKGKARQTGSGILESSESEGIPKPILRNQESQWDSEDSDRARSLSGLSPFLVSEANQTHVIDSKDRMTQTKIGSKGGKSVMVQAFEDDPWGGLLSKQEICDLIKIDEMVGLGMRGQPDAVYNSHSLTSKRILMNGVVYQIIVLKEKYIQETEITKVVEIPSKETVQEKDVEPS